MSDLKNVFNNLMASPAIPKEGEIPAQSPFDVSQRGATSATLAKFKGVPRELVINVDTYTPVIMDGETLGGKSTLAVLENTNVFSHNPEVPTPDNVETLKGAAVINKETINTIVDDKISKLPQSTMEMKLVNSVDEVIQANTLYFIK